MSLSNFSCPPCLRAVVKPLTRLPNPELSMYLTSARLSRMFLCPLSNSSQTRERSEALYAPNTIRPLMSTIATSPTVRVVVLMSI